MYHALEMRFDVITVTACNIRVVNENPKIITAHLLRVNVLTTLFRLRFVTNPTQYQAQNRRHTYQTFHFLLTVFAYPSHSEVHK